MKKNGFTLVEIMITISIIAVLAAVSISVFSTVQKNNRDQKRMRDLQTIKQALELYRSDYGAYPSDSSTLITKNYLAAWPTDPIGRSYIYRTTAIGFVVCAKKEGNIPNLDDCLGVICGMTACDIGLQSD